jgi:rare lipoprotein A
MALTATVAVAALGGCASTQGTAGFASGEPMFPESKWGVSASRRVAGHNERIPKGGGTYKVGEPYQVGGRWYNPREQPDYDRIGTASWYGSDFHGRRTANGEVFDMHALTAAHPTLPLPSYAYVTNLSNNRTILVRVNDRGPYVGNRMIDLSRESARMLGLLSGGTGRVRVRYAGPAPLDGNDARERQFAASRSWNGGGTEVAALERAQSAREWAPYRDRAPAESWVPPVGPGMTTPDRSQLRSYGQVQDQDIRQSYADAGSQAGSGELWSPERYRAAIAAR